MKSILLSLVSLLFVSCLSDTKKSNTDYTVQMKRNCRLYCGKQINCAKKAAQVLYYVINKAGTELNLLQ
jgi:FKBP-type peptidyl-prolyl cis-trans isomerase FkpA